MIDPIDPIDPSCPIYQINYSILSMRSIDHVTYSRSIRHDSCLIDLLDY